MKKCPLCKSMTLCLNKEGCTCTTCLFHLKCFLGEHKITIWQPEKSVTELIAELQLQAFKLENQ